MAHLTAPSTERTIKSVEVVSDDTMQVLEFTMVNDTQFTIRVRPATERTWSARTVATLDRVDAEVVATILQGGHISEYGRATETIDGLSRVSHSIEVPASEKPMGEGDCTPLDIERAKAANLKEERELVQLNLERDHALDRHVTADVPGCPACERKYPQSLQDLPLD